MRLRPLVPAAILRWLVMLTAVANIIGNPLLIAFQEPAFTKLGIALPRDPYLFTLHCALSFTMGVVALVAYIRPDRGVLVIGIVGKGLYATITYYFWVIELVSPWFLLFVVWDAAFVIVFFLYWIQLAQPELRELGHSIYAGIDTRHGQPKRALIIGLSLTGNGRRAIDRLAAGLGREGYAVDIGWLHPDERIYRYPMSLASFAKVNVRAALRQGGRSRVELDLRHDWDLVVVESPTWLLGAAGPVEAFLASDDNRALFRGRDAAAVVICRGAWQRTQAMLVRGLQRAGANVVAGRAFAHQGWEPARLCLLWWKHMTGKDRLWGVTYGLSDQTLDEIEELGADLARRVRNRPHWTLLEEARHA
jgi:hypothetical protein